VIWWLCAYRPDRIVPRLGPQLGVLTIALGYTRPPSRSQASERGMANVCPVRASSISRISTFGRERGRDTAAPPASAIGAGLVIPTAAMIDRPAITRRMRSLQLLDSECQARPPTPVSTSQAVTRNTAGGN
jgi:hypothetical protein